MNLQAVELKKLQTPLYEEFYNSLNLAYSPGFLDNVREEAAPSYLKLPPKSRSPSRCPVGTPSATTDGLSSASPGSNNSRCASNVGNMSGQSSPDVGSPQPSELKSPAVDVSLNSRSPRLVVSSKLDFLCDRKLE